MSLKAVPTITPEHIVAVVSAMCECLHCLDDEAQKISTRISRTGCPDGVQVLEDVELVMKAAAGLLIADIRESTIEAAGLLIADIRESTIEAADDDLLV